MNLQISKKDFLLVRMINHPIYLIPEFKLKVFSSRKMHPKDFLIFNSNIEFKMTGHFWAVGVFGDADFNGTT